MPQVSVAGLTLQVWALPLKALFLVGAVLMCGKTVAVHSILYLQTVFQSTSRLKFPPAFLTPVCDTFAHLKDLLFLCLIFCSTGKLAELFTSTSKALI